jgi:diacylglycerol O-acyltransferase / wax synthase
VIIKMDHVMTDGMGLVILVALLGDPTRKPRDLGAMPAIPQPESQSPFDLAAEAVTNTGQRILGFVGRSANAAARAIPTVVLRPVDTAGNVTKNVRALVRILAPPLKTLSPLMTERRGWMRFAALEFDLERLRKASKPSGCTVNDAFVTAVAHGFALYHERHGKLVERLRAAIVVNIRRQGDSSLGNHVMGAAIALPVSTDDPAGAMAIYHDLIKELKKDVRLPSATGIPTMVNALGPVLSLFFGMLMKDADETRRLRGLQRSRRRRDYVPRRREGRRALPLPLVGAAANCTIVGYNHKAFVGINVDAAAVPDLDMLAGCIREGFDAVIALGDVS